MQRVDLSYLVKIKNIRHEKETMAIAKTPEHRKNARLLSRYPLTGG